MNLVSTGTHQIHKSYLNLIDKTEIKLFEVFIWVGHT